MTGRGHRRIAYGLHAPPAENNSLVATRESGRDVSDVRPWDRLPGRAPWCRLCGLSQAEAGGVESLSWVRAGGLPAPGLSILSAPTPNACGRPLPGRTRKHGGL